MLAAQLPDKPTIVTEMSDLVDEVVIQWICNLRGSPATDFIVEIRESDGLSFTQEQVHCQQQDAIVLAT